MPKKSTMPARRRGKIKKNNLKIGIIFSVLISFLILLSLFVKVINVLQQGKYDSNYPFSLRVISGKDMAFLSVSEKERKIAILKVTGLDKQEPLSLPSEGEVSANSLPTSNVSSFFRSLLGNKKVESNLTIVDMLRLYLFSRSIDSKDVTIENISKAVHPSDKAESSLFLDQKIVLEDKRIEVVNATGVYGVGGSVAKLLTNLGANVVFVSTSDKNEKESAIYFHGEKGYTVKRLERVLGFKPLKRAGESISDITVRIGQNSLKSIDQ